MSTHSRRIFITGFWILAFCIKAYEQDSNALICVNQLGFYPAAPKIAIVKTEQTGLTFFLLDARKRDTVFRGQLGDPLQSTNSSLKTRVADFSNFKHPGRFVLMVDSLGESYPFNIESNANHDAAVAALKGFYYQRVSEPLVEQYAGKWKRPAGHPDDSVFIHPSAE